MAPGFTSVDISPIRATADEARAVMDQLDRTIRTIYPGQPVHGIDAAEFEQQGGYFVVARQKSVIGCGAFRPIDRDCAEIKRMFTAPEARRRGVARGILRYLEAEIRRRNFTRIILETGRGQPEAISLYLSEGFVPTPPYLEYVGNPVSRCFEKKI